MEQKCPYCNSEELIKRGMRKTKNRGNIQRYSCKSCNKRFVVKDAFFRMRNTPEKITASLDMYFRGVSLRKSQEFLGTFFKHNCTYRTILNWIVKYCSMIGNFTDNLEINTSSEITFDEVEFKTKGKKSWFFDVMDMETRYMLASDYFYSRGSEELLSVMKQVVKKSKNAPTHIYSDGLNAYPEVIRKAYYNERLSHKITHKVTKSTDKAFNWKIERLHGNIRERTKVMRQFNSLNSAKAIMKGYEIFYNFCRKHQGINKYPYELATDIELGSNKWLGLIELAQNSNGSDLINRSEPTF